MEWLIENWYVLLGILAVLVAGGFAIYKFAGLPTAEQIVKIKKMLLYWVTLAEKELGSGTGELKLRYVYDLFLVKFPFTAKLVSFEAFSLWIDEALDEMKKLLQDNNAISKFVNEDNLTITPLSTTGLAWVNNGFAKTTDTIITSTTKE
jgi:hypothetical protein